MKIMIFPLSSDLKTLGQAPAAASKGNAALDALSTCLVLCFGFLLLLNAPLEGNQKVGLGPHLLCGRLTYFSAI